MKGGQYSKIRQILGSLLKSFAGDPKTSGNESNPGTVSWSSLLMVLPTFISQLKGRSKSRGSIKPGTVDSPHCRTLGTER